jgi:hypothetical protein
MNNNKSDLTIQEKTLSSRERHERSSQHRAEELNNNYLSQPLPLQREVAQPKPFPFEALGSILGPAARRIHEIVKAPDSICGQSVLAAAALITQAYADISIDGRTHPLSLFMLTAAESGDRKSAVDNIVLKPIRDYEKKLAENFVSERQRYKNKLDAWKKHRERITRDSTPEDLEAELNKMSQEPRPPLEPHFLLEEPSYEGLVKLYAVGQPSMGLFSDEGGRMFGGYAMGKENMLKTACGLSSLWDGKPITRTRGGDENLLLYGRRFSSHLMIQEVVLSDVLKNDMLGGQGLIARFLIVSAISNAGERPYSSIDVSRDSSILKFYGHTSELLKKPRPLKNPDIQNELFPRLLELSADAKAKWVLFHDEIDGSLKPDGALRDVRRTANKAAEQALRIAGVLMLIEDFDAESISLDAIERAIVLTRFYLDEALRIGEMNNLDPDLGVAQAVLDWMRRRAAKEGNVMKTFSLQDIYQRAGPRDVRNKKMALKVMGILEEHKTVGRSSQEKLEWRLNFLPKMSIKAS